MKFIATINGKTFYKPADLKKYMLKNKLYHDSASGTYRTYQVSYSLVRRSFLEKGYNAYDPYAVYVSRFGIYL